MKSRLPLCLSSICILILSIVAGTRATAQATAMPQDTATITMVNGYQPTWWKEAVVYQVYPRSFKDSNGDGIGDLPGITSKLDYIQGLGVNVIWLSPHFDSPNADNGYDIRDYRKVMTEFGTMADFDAMLAGIKQRHMRLIIDLVVNHTSDEHQWFVESRKSLNVNGSNPYRDYYLWRPAKNGVQGQPPNNYTSFFSGSAWQFDKATNEYYLHYFAVKQPDLNWDNRKVRDEVYGLMKFWLDKGVDGFRMDVIPFISKNQSFPDLPPGVLKEDVYAAGPHLHDYLQEMNREVLSKYDVMTVGEALGISLAQTPTMVDDRRHELNMVFQLAIGRIDKTNGQWHPYKLEDMKAIYRKFDEGLDKHSWNTVYLSNHDSPRVLSRFGDDAPAFRVASAKLLATLLLTQKGTPFMYQGDELGMTDFPFTNIRQFDDIEVKNAYKAKVLTHQVAESAFIANLRHTSRDNARTPMQWDSSAEGGFTTSAKPWLAVNPNYTTINAQQELADPNSVYHYFMKMIALRHSEPVLVYGDYKDLDPQHPAVFAYTRVMGEKRYLIVMNFSEKPITYTVPDGIKAGRVAIANLGTPEENTAILNLRGWEARVYTF